MTTTYTATTDWTAIHAAAHLCDAARRGTVIGRIDGIADVFGGYYHAAYYESRGLAGLVDLAGSADHLATQAWAVVHSGHLDLAAAAVVRADDSGPWCCTMPDGAVRRAHSRRGARWMATRHGGTAARIADGTDAGKRRAAVAGQIRAAVEVAIHVDALRRLLAAAGVIEYRPAQTICGVEDGRVHLAGIRWLRGDRLESNTPPTVEEARAVVASL